MTGLSDEDVDLAPDRRAFIADTYARLGTLTHHDLLGVPRDADKKAIKQAYFKLASVVHTDRYFGKRLGRYKPMMEAIFVRLTESFEALARRAPTDARGGDAKSDAKKGQVAKTAAAPVATPAPPIATPAPLRAQPPPPSPERLEEARAKGRALAERAARAGAAGDIETAVATYRMALALLPQDRDLRARYEAVARTARERLADNLVRQATLEERYGHFAEAAATWARVLEANPAHPDAARRKAEAETRSRANG